MRSRSACSGCDQHEVCCHVFLCAPGPIWLATALPFPSVIALATASGLPKLAGVMLGAGVTPGGASGEICVRATNRQGSAAACCLKKLNTALSFKTACRKTTVPFTDRAKDLTGTVPGVPSYKTHIVDGIGQLASVGALSGSRGHSLPQVGRGIRVVLLGDVCQHLYFIS